LEGVDLVIHTAGYAHADRAGDMLDLNNRINFIATRELAHASAHAGVERFVFLSSVRAQCGASATEVIREQQEPRPTDPYGRSKLAAEEAVKTAGVPFTILRPVVVYGHNPKGNFRLLLRLSSLPLPLPLGSLNARRSVLGIDNLIAAILFVLNNSATIGETYLVADPRPFTIAELLTMIRKAQGRRTAIFRVPPKVIEIALWLVHQQLYWERLVGQLVVDTAKLESAGWHPVIDTSAGLSAMLSTDTDDFKNGKD
jgi:UDP-glucose 4-epimerase